MRWACPIGKGSRIVPSDRADKDVVIDDVFIRNEDDSIVLKTDKFGFLGDVENVAVKNSVIWHGRAGNALEIGYETMGNHIRNVRFQNIDIVRSDTQDRKFRRAALSIHAAGNARISDIRYEDIRVEAAMEHLIHFELVTDLKQWGSGRWHPLRRSLEEHFTDRWTGGDFGHQRPEGGAHRGCRV